MNYSLQLKRIRKQSLEAQCELEKLKHVRLCEQIEQVKKDLKACSLESLRLGIKIIDLKFQENKILFSNQFDIENKVINQVSDHLHTKNDPVMTIKRAYVEKHEEFMVANNTSLTKVKERLLTYDHQIIQETIDSLNENIQEKLLTISEFDKKGKIKNDEILREQKETYEMLNKLRIFDQQNEIDHQLKLYEEQKQQLSADENCRKLKDQQIKLLRRELHDRQKKYVVE